MEVEMAKIHATRGYAEVTVYLYLISKLEKGEKRN